MSRSYRAVYEQGRLHWLGEQPVNQRSHVIVTVLDDAAMDEATPAKVNTREQLCKRLEQTHGA